MNLRQMVRLAQAYSKMGAAVQEQLRSVVEMGVEEAYDADQLNPNALEYMMPFLELAARYDEDEEAIELVADIYEWQGNRRSGR